MLFNARISKDLWAEVVNHVYYLDNRSPSNAVELKTPIEV